MSDIESRLQQQLATRAGALPEKQDRLDSVRARGRRRQLLSRGAISATCLAGVLAVAGVASMTLNDPTESTYAVGSTEADADQRSETLGVEDVDAENLGATDLDDKDLGDDHITSTTCDEQDENGGDGDSTDADPGDTPAVTTPPSGNPDGSGSDGDQTDGDGDDDGPDDGDKPDEEPTTDPPDNPTTPSDGGLIEISSFDYAGAFRLSSERSGDSDTNYAVGSLAFNPERNSLFVAGHAHHNAIAEFEIPAALGTGNDLASLPVVERPRQPFSTVFDRVSNPDGIDRITGMYVTDGTLLVNGENWYDAAGQANDTSLVISDADNLDGAVSGFYQLEGRAMAGGYISPVPENWQSAIGGSALTGWASNYSIVSRYSVGPTIYGFSPEAMAASPAGPVETVEQMAFPYSGGSFLSPDALVQKQGGASATWNMLSRGVYGFIVPGSRTFAVVGSSGGIDSGIGYKITQSDGNLCGGSCSYDADDNYNYYWLFDLDDVLGAADTSDPQPYAQGRWAVPFDDGGEHEIIGATFDAQSGTLYMSLSEAGQVDTYDRPPLIVAYNIG